VRNEALRHQGVWENGDIAPRIYNRLQLQMSEDGRFFDEKYLPVRKSQKTEWPPESFSA
jgi:hypothetical protein